MNLRLLALPFVFALACSSRDQSLGQTIHTQPIIDPDPDPDPDPNPNPSPVPPCEDTSLHAAETSCEASCLPTRTVVGSGYECPAGFSCCDNSVGCGASGCPSPTVPPCEDVSLHPHVGKCRVSCSGPPNTSPDYECPPGLCCDDPPGCGAAGCTTAMGGMPQGGTTSQGGNAGSVTAGAGGAP